MLGCDTEELVMDRHLGEGVAGCVALAMKTPDTETKARVSLVVGMSQRSSVRSSVSSTPETPTPTAVPESLQTPKRTSKNQFLAGNDTRWQKRPPEPSPNRSSNQRLLRELTSMLESPLSRMSSQQSLNQESLESNQVSATSTFIEKLQQGSSETRSSRVSNRGVANRLPPTRASPRMSQRASITSTGGVERVESKGVFFHEGMSPLLEDQEMKKRTWIAADVRQYVDFILKTEDITRSVAQKLYSRFNGDPDKLYRVHDLLSDRWGFPGRLYPLLGTLLQRACGHCDQLRHITLESWEKAFTSWLKVLQERCEQTKMSRQYFLKTQSGPDIWEVYFMGAMIGAGQFGQVRVAFHKELGAVRVVKSIDKVQLKLPHGELEDEVNHLKSLDHPHIIRLFEAFETEECLCIVMDFAEGGDLRSITKEVVTSGSLLPENWVLIAVKQLCTALAFMHEKNIIHCDIKPGNVMLLRPFVLADAQSGRGRPHILVADLGLSELFEETTLTRTCGELRGTFHYLSPEGFKGHMSQKSDLWATGITVYELLLGKLPWTVPSKNPFMLWRCAENDEPDYTGLSDGARDFISSLLLKDPAKRPTAEQAGKHAWFLQEIAMSKPSKPMSVYSKASYFHRAIMFCIASGLGMKDVHDIFEAFEQMDANHNGQISIDELREGLLVLGIRQDAEALMKLMDMDGNGEISYTEFLAGSLKYEQEYSTRQVRYAFDMFDQNGDGYISLDELQTILRGDGPLADMLPDGMKVEEVMEVVSQGQGIITFNNFCDYVKSVSEVNITSTESHATPSKWLAHLETTAAESGGGTPKSQECWSVFPIFNVWLDGLFEDSHQAADFNKVLIFADRELEASYVRQYMVPTCRQIILLSLCLMAYIVWTISMEILTNTVRAQGGRAVQIVHIVACLLLVSISILTIVRCSRWIWCPGGNEKNGNAQNRKAVQIEIFLGSCGCFIPWVMCFFVSHGRLCALLGVELVGESDVAESDYHLVMVLLFGVIFVTVRTHFRFACVFFVAASIVMAYVSSSLLLMGHNRNERDLAWPTLLLIVASSIALLGHHNIEYNRRLTFHSLWASYLVLKGVKEEQLRLATETATSARDVLSTETRSERLKGVLEIVTRLGGAIKHSSIPLYDAFKTIGEILEGTRDDILYADRLVAVDVGDLLERRGVFGCAKDELLSHFDSLPAPERLSSIVVDGSVENDALSVGIGPPEGWGLNTLHNMTERGQFARLAKTCLEPAAKEAAQACGSWGLVSVRLNELLQELQCLFDKGPKAAEARATLTLHSVNWLAKRLGLWRMLGLWERVALLIAASGLHCSSEAECGGGGSFLPKDSLPARVASISNLLAAIDKCGFAAVQMGSTPETMRGLIFRFLVRAQPRCALDDARRIRMRLNWDDRLSMISMERTVLAGVVLSAADLAYLAMPHELHKPWAEICRDEAIGVATKRQEVSLAPEVQITMDVNVWLCELIEIQALPVYETLNSLDGVAEFLKEPLQNLNDNVKHWKRTQLVAHPREEGDLVSKRVYPTSRVCPPPLDTLSSSGTRTVQIKTL